MLRPRLRPARLAAILTTAALALAPLALADGAVADPAPSITVSPASGADFTTDATIATSNLNCPTGTGPILAIDGRATPASLPIAANTPPVSALNTANVIHYLNFVSTSPLTVQSAFTTPDIAATHGVFPDNVQGTRPGINWYSNALQPTSLQTFLAAHPASVLVAYCASFTGITATVATSDGTNAIAALVPLSISGTNWSAQGTVTVASTATTIQADQATHLLTATVTATTGTAAPEGTVQFWEGDPSTPVGDPVALGTPSGTSATATITPTHDYLPPSSSNPPTPLKFGATFTPADTTAFLASQTDSSALAPITVAATATATTLTDVQNGDGTVTLTAVVTADGGAVPRGTVGFAEHTAGGHTQNLVAKSGSTTLDGTGTASIVIDAPAPGTHSIFASFTAADTLYVTGSAKDFQGSTSPDVDLVIAAPPTATTTSLQAHMTGTTASLTATVSPAAAGTVTFFDGATPLGSAATVNAATGVATATATGLSVGAHSFIARFAPADATAFASSTSSATTGTAVGTLAAPTPTISGTAKVGSKLTAKAGAWTPGTKLAYQWYASGKAISKATGTTLTLTAAQYKKTITVKVTGTKAGYTTVKDKASKATTSVAAGTLKTATPTITGTAKVGKTLKAKTGTWTTGTKLTYQWYAGGTKIAHATKSSLKLAKAQRGKTITVRVTGTLTGYTTVTKASRATKKTAK